MNIEFEDAKNGELTCKFNNLYLHSKYNPEQEALRFSQNISVSYVPEIIILIEPCLSYTVKFIRQKFPESKIYAIRFFKEFKKSDTNFDFVFYPSDYSIPFSEILYDYFGEEKLCSALILQWENAAKVFPEENKNIWKEIKLSLEKAKTVLITRQFFEKKWFINSLNYFKYVNKTFFLPHKINSSIAVIASGPSLQNALPFIKENQNKLFIIVLSSAISVCIKNKIKIDLCLSTDGGYWAGQHLKLLEQDLIPLALPPEAFCKKSLLEKLPVFVLNYPDGISNSLIKASQLKFSYAERNGTVSGTAITLAQKITDKKVFCFGLDLSSQKGFQHTLPNEIENNNQPLENRIQNRMTRLTKSEFNSDSLKIYEQWFKTQNFPENKIFRIIEKSHRKNQLGKINDIDIQEFIKLINKEVLLNNFNYEEFRQNIKIDKSKIKDQLKNEEWKKQIFPLDFVSLQRNPDSIELKQKIENEVRELKEKADLLL